MGLRNRLAGHNLNATPGALGDTSQDPVFDADPTVPPQPAPGTIPAPDDTDPAIVDAAQRLTDFIDAMDIGVDPDDDTVSDPTDPNPTDPDDDPVVAAPVPSPITDRIDRRLEEQAKLDANADAAALAEDKRLADIAAAAKELRERQIEKQPDIVELMRADAAELAANLVSAGIMPNTMLDHGHQLRQSPVLPDACWVLGVLEIETIGGNPSGMSNRTSTFAHEIIGLLETGELVDARDEAYGQAGKERIGKLRSVGNGVVDSNMLAPPARINLGIDAPEDQSVVANLRSQLEELGFFAQQGKMSEYVPAFQKIVINQVVELAPQSQSEIELDRAIF